MAAIRASWKPMAQRVCGRPDSCSVSRSLHSLSRCFAAQNFTMPAMSPTMTEGNISAWKVKEGDSFSTGDVLLEIETDKAQMDVEAQDDGIMAKITQNDGSKSVKVGSRIAVLAEQGDDLSSLEIPAEELAPTEGQGSKESESKPEPPQQSSSSDKPTQGAKPPGSPRKQTYPLYPSVQHLLHSHGLPLSEADRIPASGPAGRLLKGDVLAYLGNTAPDYASNLSIRVTKLGHLDLSNIKKAPPKQMESKDSAPEKDPQEPKSVADKTLLPPPPPAEVTLPISLEAVLSVQARLEETLDTHLPLSTFISRAAKIANANLPISRPAKRTSPDDLFNQILGLDQVHHSKTSSGSNGRFVPQVAALTDSTPSLTRTKSHGADVYDLLTGKSNVKSRVRLSALAQSTSASQPFSATNTFRVTARQGDEKRAMVFLERVKAVLEKDPGRLVL